LIKLRLQRKGRKKRPFYHIVVADSRSPRDGRIIERLGRFDNVSEKKELTYDEERVIHWLKIGAQPSDTVRSILKKEGILYKMHLIRWGKSEEEIEAALEEWRAAKEAKYGDDTVSRKKKQAELLKAEEKEYKKQLEEKAAAAAKELEKKKLEEEAAKAEQEAKEAEEKAEKEAAAKAKEAEEPVKEEASEEKAEEKAPEEEEKAAAPKEDDSEEEEVKAEEADAEEEEPAAETAPEEEKEEKPEAEVEAKVEKEEKPEAEVEAKKEKEEEKSSVSTDMNANEAIDHIKNSSLEELEGFVPENEDRVTVQRAWESKQADAE
jgi:ribosomal protein S16